MDEGLQFDVNILAIDAAIAHTGYAAFSLSTGNFNFKLTAFGQILTSAGDQTDSRTRFLLSKLNNIIEQNRINYVILEEPKAAYGGRKGFVKVGGVIKIIASCYSIIGYCYSKEIYIRTIQAMEWQRYMFQSEKIDKGMSKKYSSAIAKKTLDYLQANYKPKDFNEHSADAINIGVYTISMLEQKKWELPNVQHEEVA